MNNAKTSGCSDTATGAGTQAVPYCTLQAAADAVVAGDTVLVAPGFYSPFTITVQGTAAAPITFESSIIPASPLQNDSIRIGGLTEPNMTHAHAIDVEKSSYVDLENFWVEDLVTSDAVLINSSQNVTLNEFMDWSAYTPTGQSAPDIHVAGSSTDVSVTRASLFNDYGQPYIQVDAGGSGDVIADNAFWGNSVTPVVVSGSPNSAITGNSFLIGASAAISLSGTSPGSTIENNIVAYNNFTGTGGEPIEVGTGSTSGTVLDYNVVEGLAGDDYQWGTATYATAAALHSATGQGAHDINATADIYVGGDVLLLRYDSPGIDSANAAAPGEQSTDIYGLPCVDDPSYQVTGAGTPAYCTRGSFQYQDPLTGLLTATATGSMSFKADATQSHGLNGITSYSFNFGDGSAPLVNTTGTANYTYPRSGFYTITVTVTDSTGATSTSAGSTVQTQASDFTPMTPTRIVDTRSGLGMPGSFPAKIYNNGNVTFAVPNAAVGAKAVALTVTVTNATGHGALGDYSWYTSAINYSTGQTISTTVIAPEYEYNNVMSASLFNTGTGSIDVIVDITGYFSLGSTSGYNPVAPARLLDTRTSTGGHLGKVTTSRPVTLGIAGADGGAIPSSGVTAVAVNLTTTDSAGGGYLAAYPDGTTPPGTSNVNFGTGLTRAAFAIVPVGSDGKIEIADPTPGTTDLIVDVVGYFDSNGGSAYVNVDAYRAIDTRNGDSLYGCDTAKGALAPHTVLTADLACPKLGTGSTALGNVTAVAVSNTVTGATAAGYLTNYPAGTSQPISSNLNWQPGNTLTNLTIAATGNAEEVSFANTSRGSVQLIVDVYGFFVNS